MPPLGSSPHARGARGTSWLVASAPGIIPACAGSTCPLPSRRSSCWDHPRMRGEHWLDPYVALGYWGSSPHARGARPFVDADAQARGIIPACAGSTLIAGAGMLAWRDHPRMRGEHLPQVSSHISPQGSSPHARGARVLGISTRAKRGIIPACAGSTRPPHGSPGCPGDPRMRGKHMPRHLPRLPRRGSSPHARGAPVLGTLATAVLGIIPACAGSTRHIRRGLLGQGDHPRMRGEHTRDERCIKGVRGSSEVCQDFGHYAVR